MDTTNLNTIESSGFDAAFRVHWRAIVAGFFISLLSYLILMSLGVAVGAAQIMDVMRGEDSLQSLGWGAGIWTVISVLISLFIGAYASARVSTAVVTRVGYVQGAVIAALFFTLMLAEMGMALGMVGRGVGALGGAAGNLADNPRITQIVEDSMGDLSFRMPPREVVAGFTSRLLRGDQDSAVAYLSAQTGIPRDAAMARYQDLHARLQTLVTQIGRDSAQAAQAAGWTAFGTLLLGAIFAMIGGLAGAQMNLRKPVDRLDANLRAAPRPAFT
jgi:hypothetical protein